MRVLEAREDLWFVLGGAAAVVSVVLFVFFAASSI
jgi:hypothetical protein